MKATTDEKFSTLREIFFPIYHYELKKIVPLGIILFITLFNHYCLKNIKDSLIVTNVGAEALAYIKLFCVPPAAIIAIFGYTRLSDHVKNENLFYSVLSIFLIFFACFTFVLYPHRNLLHPNPNTITHWQLLWPSLYWFFSILGVWSYALFFVFAELWSSFLLTLLFWQFVNQITELKDAKRIYAFLAIIGQGAVACSGFIGSNISDLKNHLHSFDPWQSTLNYLTCILLITSVLAMYLHHWIYKNVLTDPKLYNKPYLPGVRVKKNKTSLRKSLRIVFRSPYLGFIALLVICYGINDNILENFWKHELKYQFPNINDYNTFVCKFTMTYGILSIFVLIFAGYVFRRFKWGVGALITPLVVSIGGALLFGCILSKHDLCCCGAIFHHQMLIIGMGFIVLILTKSAKMSFFDLSKEMAYIPLNEEIKVKGKAVVDVLGYRFGKSGGSGLQVILLTLFSMISGVQGTYKDIAPYAFFIFLISSGLWIMAVLKLSRKMNILTKPTDL